MDDRTWPKAYGRPGGLAILRRGIAAVASGAACEGRPDNGLRSTTVASSLQVRIRTERPVSAPSRAISSSRVSQATFPGPCPFTGWRSSGRTEKVQRQGWGGGREALPNDGPTYDRRGGFNQDSSCGSLLVISSPMQRCGDDGSEGRPGIVCLFFLIACGERRRQLWLLSGTQ